MSEIHATSAKIAIYGAGAMGTVLGALLTKGGLENVHLITRNAQHVNALNAKGATIVCQADKREINVKVQALLPTQMQGEYDVIFLMTKQRHNQEILKNFCLSNIFECHALFSKRGEKNWRNNERKE